MKVALRVIQGVAVGKWQQKEELEKRLDVVDKRLVGAAARHHRCMFAGGPAVTFVKEWELDNYAGLDKMIATLGADKEWQAPGDEDVEK
jgi:hypothetical protein